jgi:hypothetical protein
MAAPATCTSCSSRAPTHTHHTTTSHINICRWHRTSQCRQRPVVCSVATVIKKQASTIYCSTMAVSAPADRSHESDVRWLVAAGLPSPSWSYPMVSWLASFGLGGMERADYRPYTGLCAPSAPPCCSASTTKAASASATRQKSCDTLPQISARRATGPGDETWTWQAVAGIGIQETHVCPLNNSSFAVGGGWRGQLSPTWADQRVWDVPQRLLHCLLHEVHVLLQLSHSGTHAGPAGLVFELHPLQLHPHRLQLV